MNLRPKPKFGSEKTVFVDSVEVTFRRYVHYIMPFNMTNAVLLKVRGSLSGNINAALI